MKKRKENDIPDALLQNQEPAKKRSKLVLPSPQITDQVRVIGGDTGVAWVKRHRTLKSEWWRYCVLCLEKKR